MVQGLAAQSGGLLHIDSEPNAGTMVELWLPKATSRRGTYRSPTSPMRDAAPTCKPAR